MKLSDSTYDKLKFIALVVFPAVGTLFYALNSIWNFTPWGEQILGTITAIDTFLGALLKHSSDNYWRELNEEENH